MADLEKNNKLIKGAEVLKQDMFRAVTEKETGRITFQPVKMANICFVKFDGIDKVYAFNNPSDKRLKIGSQVIVDTIRGEQRATVISNIKIQNKYIKNLMNVIGNNQPLKDIISVVETKEVITEVTTKIEDINGDNKYVESE